MTFPTPTLTPTPTTPASGLAARQISIPNFTIPTSIDINLSFTLPSSIGGITLPTSLPGITIQVNTPTSSTPSTSPSASSTSTSSTSPSSSTTSSGSSKSRTPILAGIFTAVGLLALILLLLLLWYCRRRRRRRANDADAFEASGYHEKPRRSAPSGGRTWWRPRGGNAVAATPSMRSSAASLRTSSDALPATNESPMAFSAPTAAAYAGVGTHGRHSSGDYDEYRKEETMHTALLAPPPPAMTPSEGMLSPTSTFDYAASSALVSPDSLDHYTYGSYFPAHAAAGPGFSQGDPARYALLGGGGAAGAASTDPFADNASGSSGTTTDVPNNAPYAHAFGLGPGDPDYLFIDHPGAGVYPWLAYSRRNTSTSARTGSVLYQTGGSGPSTPGLMGAPQYPRVPFPRQWTDESGTTMYFTPTGEEIPQARRMGSQANYAEWFGHSSGAAAASAAGAAPPEPASMLSPPPPAARSASSSGNTLPTIHERGDGLLPQPATDGVTPSSVRDEGDYTKARKLTVANE